MSRFPTKDLPQSSRLNKVLVGDVARVSGDFSNPLLMLCVQAQCLGFDPLDLGIVFGRLESGVDVVRISTVIVIESHLAVSLEWAVHWDLGCVSRELLIVHTEAIAGSVGVGE